MGCGGAGQLRLGCKGGLGGGVIDCDGQGVVLVADGEEHFTVTVELVVSPNFWGGIFGLGDGVEVLSPDWAVEEFTTRLKTLLTKYE